MVYEFSCGTATLAYLYRELNVSCFYKMNKLADTTLGNIFIGLFN
jgi:hypothetical protein